MDNGVGLHHEASAESLATAHTHRHTRKTKHVTYKETQGSILKKEPSEKHTMFVFAGSFSVNQHQMYA